MGSLRLATVTKQYDDVVAVDGIDLDITDSEFISLVGPSGCGKSTTLEMIGGLTTPSDGKVFIDDQDVTDLPPKDRNLAMVFQNIALFPHMNVYDNISYGLRIRNTDPEEIERRVNDAAETLQLEGLLERSPSELSGGQRQRVAIGRAIVRNPSVFLMDEPLANLDAKLRVHMRTELQQLQRELDVTTIYVTHDQEEAMTMSDRVAVINDGTLQQIAPPLTCYNEPANRFVAGFIGSPSMNFVDGSIKGTQFVAESLRIDLGDIDCDGVSDVTLGIRPEHIHFPDADLPENTEPIDATVDVLEPIGEKIFVYLDAGLEKATSGDWSDAEDETVGRSQFLMSAPSDSTIEEGESVEIVFDRTSIHLFETATGEAIAHGIVSEPTKPPR